MLGLVGAAGWPDVMIAGVAALQVIGLALIAKMRSDSRTPSGGTLGSRVESTHDSAVANNKLLRELVDADAQARSDELGGSSTSEKVTP